jgi:hypothetical protein
MSQQLSVSREAGSVIIVVRPTKGAGPTAALVITHRGAAALWPMLMAATLDESADGYEAECEVRGELTTGAKL